MIVFSDQPPGNAPVGGKAAALMALTGAGFHSPAFFTILPEAFTGEGPTQELTRACPKRYNPWAWPFRRPLFRS